MTDLTDRSCSHSTQSILSPIPIMTGKTPEFFLELHVSPYPTKSVGTHQWDYSIRLINRDSTQLDCTHGYLEFNKGGYNSKYYQSLRTVSSVHAYGHSGTQLVFRYDRITNSPICELESESMYRTLKRLNVSIARQELHRELMPGIGNQLIGWCKAFKASGIIVCDRFGDQPLPVNEKTAARLNLLFDSFCYECEVLDQQPIDRVIVAKTDMIDSRDDRTGTKTIGIDEGYRIISIPFADRAWDMQSHLWRKNGRHVEITDLLPA